MHKNIILMGPPGSGKGTQAKKIAEHLDAFYFGAGDLMRAQAAAGSEYGKIFQKVWDQGKGELVPDEIVERFMNEKFAKADFGQGIVFDGFPRTINQAQHLEKTFRQKGEDFIVIDIEVSSKSLVERMATRRVCDKCGKIFFRASEDVKTCNECGGTLIRRQEDEPETVKKRLAVYVTQTQPLLKYFAAKGKLIKIDGEPPIEEVEHEIMKAILVMKAIHDKV